jgi:hypothetical protein
MLPNKIFSCDANFGGRMVEGNAVPLGNLPSHSANLDHRHIDLEIDPRSPSDGYIGRHVGADHA